MMKSLSGSSLNGALLVWTVLACTRLDLVSVTGSDHPQQVTRGSDHPKQVTLGSDNPQRVNTSSYHPQKVTLGSDNTQKVVKGSQTGDSVGSTNNSSVIPAQTPVPSNHAVSKQTHMDPARTAKIRPERDQRINPTAGQPPIRVDGLADVMSANSGTETSAQVDSSTAYNPPTTINNSFHYTHLLLPFVVLMFLVLFTGGLVAHYHHKVLVKTGAIARASGGVSPSTSSQGSDEQKGQRGKRRLRSTLSQHTSSVFKVRNFLTNLSNVDSIQT